jgi:Flp pilus assembly protein TadG
MERFRRVVTSPRRRDPESGAAAVEFALIVPLLIILVFGIIAFGVILSQLITLGNSARQASRFVVTQDRTCADALAQVAASASTIGMDPDDVIVEVGILGGSTLCGPAAVSAGFGGQATVKPCAGTSVGESVEVRTRFRSTLVIPLVVFNDDFQLSARGVFRCEYR